MVDVKAQRELAGVTQRDLATRTGLGQSVVSRIERGDRQPTDGERTLIELALNGNTTPKGGVRRTARRAFICTNKQCVPPRRTFLLPDEPDRVPSCKEHGRMVPA